MLVALFGFPFGLRIVQSHNYHWDVIGGAPHHRLEDEVLRSLLVPLLFMGPWLLSFFHDLDCLLILNSVPNSIASNHDKVVIIDFKTCDFRFAYHNFAWVGLGLEIPKSSCSWQPAWEDPQRSNNLIVVLSVSLSDCRSLINLSTCRNNSLLLIGIGWFVIFCNLVKFLTVLTGQNSSWIS